MWKSGKGKMWIKALLGMCLGVSLVTAQEAPIEAQDNLRWHGYDLQTEQSYRVSLEICRRYQDKACQQAQRNTQERQQKDMLLLRDLTRKYRCHGFETDPQTGVTTPDRRTD